MKSLIGLLTLLLITGCNITLKDKPQEVASTPNKLKAYYVDEPIANVEYQCGSFSGTTNSEGLFYFEKGKSCSLYLGSILLRDIDTNGLKDGSIVFESDPTVAALIQSLDKNGLYSGVIEIEDRVLSAIEKLGETSIPNSDEEREKFIKRVNSILNSSYQAVSRDEAIAHLKQSIYDYGQKDIVLTMPNASWINKDIMVYLQQNSSNSNGGATYSNTTNWYNSTLIYTSNIKEPKEIEKRNFTLLAWSELGMHCMDGEYKVFALLPPYNTLKAQLIVNGTSPRIVSSGVSVTYEAVRKNSGTINTTSQNKTNFWTYANKLFPAVQNLQVDTGLKGKKTQSLTPQTMDFNMTQNLFIAEGIPTIPKNDDGSKDEYPTVKVVAKNENGEVLASTITTLPVSDELDCMKCHSSRVDILKKHDQNFPDAVKDNLSKLQAKGFNYNQNGLEATYNNNTPILCASCHKSNALVGSGVDGVKPLTEAIHSAHSLRNDPATGQALSLDSTRGSCYYCHPGEGTKCLRGAMGNSGIECQDCHGNMDAVGKSGREGWKNEPNCQACHQDGKRYSSAVTDTSQGTLRDAIDKQFATEQTLIDIHGPRLYKDSTGHGGVSCAGCHGAQHAIYPSSVEEENLQNINLQGYKGTLRECGVCHKNNPPLTAHNGPHGLHTIGQRWVDMHGTIVLREGVDNCKKCHGSDLEGTALSKVGTRREFKLGVMDKVISFEAGEKVSCKRCHNMEVSQ